MLLTRFLFASVACLALCGHSMAADDGFTPLFDGKTLTGWHGDEALWTVEDGAIVGKTDGNIPDNQFLISNQSYGDFELRIKFRLRDHKGNSGVQYRSQEIDKLNEQPLPKFVVGGYQADIADDRHMGILYGEKTGRGIIHDVTPEIKAQLEEVVRKGDWNEYVITAQGDHVKQVLNGVTTVDIDDPDGPKNGVIALQVHRNHNMVVEFKDIEIKVMDKAVDTASNRVIPQSRPARLATAR